MNRNLLILDAGQYGKIAKEVAEAMVCFEKIDFLDDEKEFAVGKLSDYKKFVNSYSYAIVAIENNVLRINWITMLEKAGYKIAILVHPKAYVSPSAQIMKGSIIEPMAIVNSKCVISVGCIISAGAVINHNSICSDGVHIDCNAIIPENSNVPMKTRVDCGTVYRNVMHTPIKIDGIEYEFESGM